MGYFSHLPFNRAGAEQGPVVYEGNQWLDTIPGKQNVSLTGYKACLPDDKGDYHRYKMSHSSEVEAYLTTTRVVPYTTLERIGCPLLRKCATCPNLSKPN